MGASTGEKAKNVEAPAKTEHTHDDERATKLERREDKKPQNEVTEATDKIESVLTPKPVNNATKQKVLQELGKGGTVGTDRKEMEATVQQIQDHKQTESQLTTRQEKREATSDNAKSAVESTQKSVQPQLRMGLTQLDEEKPISQLLMNAMQNPLDNSVKQPSQKSSSHQPPSQVQAKDLQQQKLVIQEQRPQQQLPQQEAAGLQLLPQQLVKQEFPQQQAGKQTSGQQQSLQPRASHPPLQRQSPEQPPLQQPSSQQPPSQERPSQQFSPAHKNRQTPVQAQFQSDSPHAKSKPKVIAEQSPDPKPRQQEGEQRLLQPQQQKPKLKQRQQSQQVQQVQTPQPSVTKPVTQKALPQLTQPPSRSAPVAAQLPATQLTKRATATKPATSQANPATAPATAPARPVATAFKLPAMAAKPAMMAAKPAMMAAKPAMMAAKPAMMAAKPTAKPVVLATKHAPAVMTAKPAAAATKPAAAATKPAALPAKPAMLPAKTAVVAAKPAATTAKFPVHTAPAPPPLPPNVQRPSRALQIARLIMTFLGPNHPPPQNPQLPTLNALRTRLTTNPNYFDTNPDHLAWQVREAIRTEFFKVLYPSPPPNSLLTLVTATESIIAPFPPRPFFFPGARVAVPTEAGSRRAATSLQLRFKQVAGTAVAEALLHLDGPNGGGFQWVQAPALTPLAMYAPHTARTIQKKPKRPRVPKAARPRKKKEKALPPPPPIPAKATPKPPTAPPSRPAPAPAPAPKPTQAPTPAPPPPPAPAPAPRMAGVVARLARQEASGVHVPDALRGTSPPPRSRIIDEGRFLSHVSGVMRAAALDIDKLLGIERLVARRETDKIDYFVKWSGVPLKEGSWESREALMEDVPALVRDFEVRHPERNRDRTMRLKESEGREKRLDKKEDRTEAEKIKDEARNSSDKSHGEELTKNVSTSGESVIPPAEGKHEDGGKKSDPAVKQYIDDVTGLPVPSWLDTPIVELNIAGMVLQIRRPNEAVLHNDATSAVRDAKKRQTRFKQENILLGERLFPLTKPEAKSVIDAAAKDHRHHNRMPIPFPRGIGRVSPTDHGHPFSHDDALKAPPSWDAYFLHLGMVPSDYTRSLPPHMPTLDDSTQAKLLRARDDLAYSTACEHRERARLLLRESFKHTGAPPPEHIFRDGVRAPPGEHLPAKKKRPFTPKSSEGNSRGLLRARETVVETAFKKAKRLLKGKNGAWFDEVWGCWRPNPSQ